jgi:hypothetical protein
VARRKGAERAVRQTRHCERAIGSLVTNRRALSVEGDSPGQAIRGVISRFTRLVPGLSVRSVTQNRRSRQRMPVVEVFSAMSSNYMSYQKQSLSGSRLIPQSMEPRNSHKLYGTTAFSHRIGRSVRLNRRSIECGRQPASSRSRRQATCRRSAYSRSL